MEIGISTLDTRDLASANDANTNINTNIVKARHICTQTREIPLKGKYFLFGQSEHVRNRDITKFLGQLFYIEDVQVSRP